MPDKYNVVQFLRENNATKVVPYSWLKTEGGQLFCRWPKTYKVSEIRLAINRGDPPSSTWMDKIVTKLYPLKKEYETRIKCDMKESKLYEEGSAALDTDTSRTTVQDDIPSNKEKEEPYSCEIPSGFKSSKRLGKHNKAKKSKRSRKENEGGSSSGFGEASSAEERERRFRFHPHGILRRPLLENCRDLSQSSASLNSTPGTSRTTNIPTANTPSGSQLQDPLSIPDSFLAQGSSPSGNHEDREMELENLPRISTPSSSQKSAPRSPRSNQKIIEESNSSESGSEFGVDNLSDSDSSSSSSSSSERNSKSGSPSNTHESGRAKGSGAAVEKSSKTCSRQLLAASANMTEPPLRTVLRRLYKIQVKMDQHYKSLRDEIAELRAQINGGTVKTSLDIVPGVQLPAKNPDQLMVVESHLLSSVDAQREFIQFLKTKAVGSKATAIGNGLMFGLMSNFCAAHLVWDGVHKGASAEVKGKLALKVSFPGIEDTLQSVMNSVATATISKDKIKSHVGRVLTLAPTRLTADEKSQLKLPWVFSKDNVAL